MILYRGTPYPEDFPEAIDYACVFFADDAYDAAIYGDYVQAYDVGTPRVLNLESKAGRRIVSRFIKTRTYPLRKDLNQAHELGIHPTDDWVKHLGGLVYDGYSFEMGICLFEPYIEGLPVRLVDRRRLEVR